MISPSCLTFLTTYKCTAACEECCFQSSPHNPSPRLTLAECVNIIDQAVESYRNMRSVIFSGGECFLLGDDLVAAVRHASSRNLLTRCVTNGYWGRNRKHARAIAGQLSAAGLTEINFSTGDDHQQFVPVRSVINAALECAERGIRALIVVEGHNRSRYTMRDLVEDSGIAAFLDNSPRAPMLQLMQNIWIPFNSGRSIEHPDALELRHRIHEGGEPGCNQLLGNLVITPDLQLACCCGLTLEYIDELKLGRVDENLKELFESQRDDFMKIWLYTDGPQKILEFARAKNPSIHPPDHAVHPCQVCALIFNDEAVKETLARHYAEMVDAVTFRFLLKQERLCQSSPSTQEIRHALA